MARALALLPLLLALAPQAKAQSPEPPEIIWEEGPLTAYFHQGYAVAWLGDLDGDEVDEYAASRPGNSRVDVYSGERKEAIATLSGSARFGHSLTQLGDLDGDGVNEFAAGTPYAFSNSGEVKVYSGASFSLLYSITGAQAGDYLGWGLASLGDTDGDGVDDILIRSYRDEGVISVYSGADGSLRYSIPPPARWEYAGEGLAGIHDVNGDGAADFLVGAPERGFGEVVLHSGADGAVLATFAGTTISRFGDAVCQLGDLNGDQLPEFAIGAPHTAQAGQTRAGEVRIYDGQSLAELKTLPGTTANHRFGELIADGGDYNRDGLADLLVASPGSDGNGLTRVGKVELISGADFSVIGTVFGTQQYEEMPSSLAGFGDAHRDLHPDYLIGNHKYGSSEGGRVRMWGAPSPWLRVDPLYVGQLGVLTVSDCRFGSTLTFYASLKGNGPTNTPYGRVLLSPPFELLGSAGPTSGSAVYQTRIIPQRLAGRTVYFQAYETKPGFPLRLTTATAGVIQ